MAEKIKTALVPVTGSEWDEQAVALACDLVKPAKGTVWVLYVIEVARKLPLDAEVAVESARGERTLERMERVAKSHKCKCEAEILQARDFGAAVVEEAAQRATDVVVVGTPYLEHYGAPTLGELVPYLLKHSPSRVIVYRDSLPSAIGAEQR